MDVEYVHVRPNNNLQVDGPTAVVTVWRLSIIQTVVALKNHSLL